VNIFITGGANGIGKEVAIRLVEKGHSVKVFDNDQEALKNLDKSIKTFQGDVRDKSDLENAMANFEVEVLINSAGFQKQGSVEDMESDTFQKHIDTNYIGTVNAVKTALNPIRRNNGRIINISSIAGKTGAPFLSAYCASKYAVEGFSDSLRMELSDSEVDVVIVEPGPIMTGFNREARENLRNYIPNSRYSNNYQERLDTGMEGLETEEAAKKVVKTVETDNPNTRYTITKEAYFVSKLKKFLPDRIWDKLVRSEF
jgi:short-subunit dehydrogenase